VNVNGCDDGDGVVSAALLKGQSKEKQIRNHIGKANDTDNDEGK